MSLHSREWYQLAAWHGARHMDKEDPGWINLIDESRLNLGDSQACILGQRFGQYYYGRETLHLTQSESFNLGFDAEEGRHEDYSMLTEAWLEEIVRRKLLPSPSDILR